jgi:hypothetical protein
MIDECYPVATRFTHPDISSARNIMTPAGSDADAEPSGDFKSAISRAAIGQDDLERCNCLNSDRCEGVDNESLGVVSWNYD